MYVEDKITSAIGVSRKLLDFAPKDRQDTIGTFNPHHLYRFLMATRLDVDWINVRSERHSGSYYFVTQQEI